MSTESTHPARFWRAVEGKQKIVCELCPRSCELSEGQRGFCFVRRNVDGELVLTTYGHSTGFCIDPIEKKPLNHFYPGSPVLSFGTAGCNLGCRFCQNHESSRARQVALLSREARPEAIARAAADAGCRSVAYTYNDPVIFAEYAIDAARACRALGVANVAVTAGYITGEARAAFFAEMDGANVDLKAFSSAFYRKHCQAELEPVLETLRYLRHETEVWFELTTLIIPDENDSNDELGRLCDWVAENLGDEVPLHFSAFHPDYKMTNKPRTPAATLARARQAALDRGIKHVYTGNVHDASGQSTYCAGCGALLIERDWYELGRCNLTDDGRCKACDHPLAGRFEGPPGDWGSRRQPLQIV